MKYLAFFSYLLFLPIVSFADDNPPVKVYCFSDDLEAGFQDKSTSYWCNELGKRGAKKKSLALVEDKDSADIRIQYLGTEEIRVQGETTYLLGGYAWTPEQFEKGARAVVTIADYNKGFHATGINFQGPGQVLRDIEKWIRENREVILQKAREK
jgi:hypothetical protein